MRWMENTSGWTLFTDNGGLILASVYPKSIDPRYYKGVIYGINRVNSHIDVFSSSVEECKKLVEDEVNKRLDFLGLRA